MLEEIIVIVDDEPGSLAEIGELLGRSGINIESLCASSHDGRGFIHLVVDDGDDANEILTSHDYKIEGTRSVLTATIEDRPGELGKYCRRLSDAGVIISAAYVARRHSGETELIFAVDDLETAQNV